MNIIWINQDIDSKANRMIAGDDVYGIGEYFVLEFEDDKGRMQTCYVPVEAKGNDYVKGNIQRFVNDVIMEPLNLTDVVVGDYWPDGINGDYQGYDVLLFEDMDLIYGGTNYGGISIVMLVEDAEEYEL